MGTRIRTWSTCRPTLTPVVAPASRRPERGRPAAQRRDAAAPAGVDAGATVAGDPGAAWRRGAGDGRRAAVADRHRGGDPRASGARAGDRRVPADAGRDELARRAGRRGDGG